MIDEGQNRPIYLKRNYGELEEGEVYVRSRQFDRPEKPASLDEIAQMGEDGHETGPNCSWSSRTFDRDDAIGAAVRMKCEFCRVARSEGYS